ncbi:MAG: MurR/RpiR family transcriptional regulator [Pseudomonadota bacterium]
MATSRVSDRLKALGSDLTKSERLIADIIFENYPASALGSVTALAERAKVSTPTVARLARKLGFSRYSHFQERIRKELDERLSNPNTLGNAIAQNLPQAHVLNEISESLIGNARQTIRSIDVSVLEDLCDLIADLSHPVFIAGGHFTRAFGDHLHSNLQLIRRDVHFINNAQGSWYYKLLDIGEGDLLIILDVRKYEKNLHRLAALAHGRGARIVLLTDQWKSPIAPLADHTLNGRLVMPSGWDSMMSLLLLNEVIIHQVRQRTSLQSGKRVEELEDILDHVKA